MESKMPHENYLLSKVKRAVRLGDDGTGADPINIRMQEFATKFSVPFTQPYDFDELINNALFDLRDFTATDRAVIFEFQSTDYLLCTYESVINKRTPKIHKLLFEYEKMKSILDEADKTGCFYERDADNYFKKYPETNLGEKSFCYIPMTIGGSLVGYLVFFSMFEHANWAENELQLISMAGSIIAGAYSRKMSEDILLAANLAELKTQDFISEFSVPFTQPYDFNTLINRALYELRDFTATDRAIILEYQQNGSLLCTYESVINDKTPKMLGNTLEYDAMRPILDEADKTGCFYKRDAKYYFEDYPDTDLYEKSFCYIPLTIGGSRAGYLVFFTMFEQANWAEDEFKLVSMVGSILAGAYMRKKSDEILRAANLALKEATIAAQQANLAKSHFLSRMSHEIRTPMNSIIGFSELALEDTISEKTKGYLRMILDNSEWLVHIINDILDISKIEAGKMDLERIPFDFYEIFTSCKSMITPKAEEKGLHMHFYAEPSEGRVPVGDPLRLTQIFVNLLSNAVKFTNAGSIKMRATLLNTTANSITMRFEIEDTGIGMSRKQIKRIFDPFRQAESGTARKYGGTGLGLTITKNLVDIMGGELQIESTVGVGSKFIFELCFDTIDRKKAKIPEVSMPLNSMEKPIFEGEVLLCEDNDMNQQVICEHLERVGLTTIVAENGKIGIKMIKERIKKEQKQFDLIFMDMHMPEMGGLEASRKIFEMNVGIPVVAMTANVMSDDRELYMKSGMSGYLGKPFTSQELWRCLLQYFKPVNWYNEDIEMQRKADEELHRKLIENFVRSNKGTYLEINKALSNGDIALAHRLSHNLKSNAGQLGKKRLQKASELVESSLRGGENNVSVQQLEVLEEELNAVVSDFEAELNDSVVYTLDRKKLDTKAKNKLFSELEPILRDSDPECLQFIDRLQLVPESDDLIHRIEAFDFKSAMKALSKLKELNC